MTTNTTWCKGKKIKHYIEVLLEVNQQKIKTIEPIALAYNANSFYQL